MMRLLTLAAALLALFLPVAAQADPADIDAAARGVVRVVIIGTDGQEVFPVSHGTGFAVSPAKIVTNAHVVREALQDDTLRIGIVPSEGGEAAAYARPIAVSPSNDLALVEITGELRLPPLTVAAGPVRDGEVSAVGYPMNVDRAQGLGMEDIFHSQPPVKSRGFISGQRPSRLFDTILHTAPIARGNSGGPLLDRCGRVIGVNSAFTRADEGDAAFAFAISGSELQGFLRAAGHAMATIGSGCVGIEERLADDRAAARQAEQASEAERAAAAEQARRARDAALDAERERVDLARENFMAIAAFLLVLGGLGLAGAALFALRGQRRNAIIAGAAGGLLMLAAVIVFLLRPQFDPDSVALPAGAAAAVPPDTELSGPLQCRLLPERSRVIVSETQDVVLAWDQGCMNARTQYAPTQNGWQRVLVPEEEQTVSVLDFDPETGIYTNSRYLLSAPQMAEARRLRAEIDLKQCAANAQAIDQLGAAQAAIRNGLPGLPNERLVYRCTPAE